MNTNTEQRSRLASRLDLLATVTLILVALLVGAVTVWDRLKPASTRAAGEEPSPPADPVSIEGAPVLGDKKAKIALITFSEFECPFCGRSARDVLPEIDRQYLRTRKAFLVWRHYPLKIHQNARKAAEGAECAGRQGKFWEFHDWAFKHQKELDQSSLAGAARFLGLDMRAFGLCLDGEATERVQSDVDLGNALSVSGTPTWFIGVLRSDGKVRVTHRLNGSKPFEDFKKVLDKVATTAEASGN